MRATVLVVATVCILPFTSSAQPIGTVEAVQNAAWLERQGDRTQVQVGASVEAGDAIATGGGTRLLIGLKDGSELRLGQDAEVEIGQATVPDAPGMPFTASLTLTRGALRLSATPQSEHGQRAIELIVGDVKLGIQHADVWAKTTARADIVMLNDGTATVAIDQAQSGMLAEAGTVLYKPKDSPALPIHPASDRAREGWLAETEIAAGPATESAPPAASAEKPAIAEEPASPAAPAAEPPVIAAKPAEPAPASGAPPAVAESQETRPAPAQSKPPPPRAGSWYLSLESSRDRAAAQATASEFNNDGIAAVIKAVKVRGSRWYRVSVEGFQSRKDAMAYADKVRDRIGNRKVWAYRE